MRAQDFKIAVATISTEHLLASVEALRGADRLTRALLRTGQICDTGTALAAASPVEGILRGLPSRINDGIPMMEAHDMIPPGERTTRRLLSVALDRLAVGSLRPYGSVVGSTEVVFTSAALAQAAALLEADETGCDSPAHRLLASIATERALDLHCMETGIDVPSLSAFERTTVQAAMRGAVRPSAQFVSPVLTHRAARHAH